jgi:hypothetical protein
MTIPLKKNRERFFVEAAAKLMDKTWTIVALPVALMALADA